MSGLTNEQIVLTPVVSEKSYSGIADRRYTFKVHPDAHKTQVRQAIERMLATARRLSAAADFQPTVLNLERRIPFGSRELAWTISAQGGGRNLTYRAAANGTKVEDVGAGGSEIPPQVQQAQELNRCIEAAGSDIDKVTACFDQFTN